MRQRRVRHRVEVDVGRMIVKTWGHSAEHIGCAWLILCQHYQNGRPFEFYDSSQPRRVLLGVTDGWWKKHRQRVLDCFGELLTATELAVQYGRRAIPHQTRLAVFERDGGRCRYCSAPVELDAFHCDHVEPVSRGGGDEMTNLVCSCVPCNLSKGAKHVDQWERRA